MQEIKEHFIDKFCGTTEEGELFLEPIYLTMPLELFNWIAIEVSQLEPQVIGNFAGVEDCYNNFWKDILEENGELDWEQVKKELFDYANILREVSIVYDTLTMGRISKPNTKAQVVIDEVNEVNREIEEDDSKISL